MKRTFSNLNRIPIDPVEPNTIRSTIEVSDLAGSILDVNVAIDVSHTFTSDLAISIVSPDGQRVELVRSEGGSGDNFQATIFDDEAPASIRNASAPFRGSFVPRESLDAFDGQDPNGTWTLGIVDTAFADGGTLNGWAIQIETDTPANAGPFVFRNREASRIDSGGPNTVVSTLDVRGLGDAVIEDIDVTLDIDHTYDSDLILTLIHPEGQRVVLAEREGRWGNDYQETTFDDSAEIAITDASPPFRGVFRPESALSAFRGLPVNGQWTLEVRDTAPRDGGMLNHWGLEIRTRGGEAPREESPFSIEVNFLGGLTESQQAVFEEAARRWSEIIVGDLPPVRIDGVTIDDVLIDAAGADLGGPGGVLGQAGPTIIRRDSRLPVRGIMEFDTADIDDMERNGTLLSVIIHEMGHVLGIGTLWSELGLLQGAGGPNPVFLGTNAMREYGRLIGAETPTPVPVANTGQAGTRDGHWRESVFGPELMTGFIDEGVRNPISRLTIASLQDLGYQVDFAAADAYLLPSERPFGRLAAAPRTPQPCRTCRARCPQYELAPVGATIIFDPVQ